MILFAFACSATMLTSQIIAVITEIILIFMYARIAAINLFQVDLDKPWKYLYCYVRAPVFPFPPLWKSLKSRIGAIAPLKPTKVTLILMFLYNSENSIRNTRPFGRPLFHHSGIVKYTSSLLQQRSRYWIWQLDITEIALLALLAGSAPAPRVARLKLAELHKNWECA